MEDIECRPFEAELRTEWDRLVGDAVNGTLMHTRRYLDYHGNRFHDASLTAHDRRGRLIGVLPAARESRESPTVIVSHPGLTYGGLIHRGLDTAQIMQALQRAATVWRSQGGEILRYKAVPSFYHRHPADGDEYALWRMRAQVYRVDACMTIALRQPLHLSGNRMRCLRKAGAANLTVRSSRAVLPAAWVLIADTLRRRHHTRPTHSLAELQSLVDLFPDHIRVHVAAVDSRTVATVVSYVTPYCWHIQYAASSPQGRRLSALDHLTAHLIDQARSAGLEWFDFGISTEAAGTTLNWGLQHYKASFGAGTTVHRFFELPLA
jgi:Acetyltransferase (GNAT) domain